MGIDHAMLLGTASRTCALTLVEPPRVERIHPDGVETIAIQGQGWGSALILVPELLGPILGKEPRLLLAPATPSWHSPTTWIPISPSGCGTRSRRVATTSWT